MSSCLNCFYGATKGNQYVVCKLFNRVINMKKFNGCPSFKTKNYMNKKNGR